MKRSRLSLGRLCILTGVACAALSIAAAPNARADEPPKNKVYDSTGFEPKPFTAGAQLLGLDGWSTAIPPFLNPAAATITGNASRNGRHSVEVRGADLQSSGGITAPYDAVGSYRRPVGPNGGGYVVSGRKSVVTLEAALLLETDQPVTENDFFSMTIAARSGAGVTVGEMGLSSAGLAVAYETTDPPGTDPATFNAPSELNQWHHVSMEIDFALGITCYYVNGDLIGATSFDPTAANAEVLLRGALVVYARPDDGANTRDDYTARFDNFRISARGGK